LAYSEKDDKLIKLFEFGDEDAALHFSIFSYDGGPRKIQMTRMFKKKDNTQGYGKAGRMTIEEMKYLRDNLDEIISVMEGEN